VKQAAIEQKKATDCIRSFALRNRAQALRLLPITPRSKNAFVRRKVLRSKAPVTRTPRKDHLGTNGNAGVVATRDTTCLTVGRLPRMRKRGSSRSAASRRRNAQF
jgi:hypothetical protein